MNATAAVAAVPTRLATASLAQLFLDARTHSRWRPEPVDEAVLLELYALARMAPTSANNQPIGCPP